jgi:hypothetical protein
MIIKEMTKRNHITHDFHYMELGSSGSMFILPQGYGSNFLTRKTHVWYVALGWAGYHIKLSSHQILGVAAAQFIQAWEFQGRVRCFMGYL